MRNVIFITFVVVVVFFLYQFVNQQLKPSYLPFERPADTIMYQPAVEIQSTVSLFSTSVPQVTQIEITPDGNSMLVGTLPGTIWIYHKIDGVFRKQVEPFFVVKTSQPGWPPQEAGLTGIVLGADFEASGDVFLNYSFAFEKKSFRNRVLRVTFTKKGQKYIGTNPTEIFEANAPGTGSHQIQDGVGIMIAGVSHVLFTIGEGFVAERALDPKQEAGKIMLLQRDGSTPVGSRPYPEEPKVQAIGIRNAPAIAYDKKEGKVAIADTGPNNFDRLIYGSLFDSTGNSTQKLSFNWDGTEESLRKGSLDAYDHNKEMILHRWAPTETAVNIAFYQNDRLPKLEADQQYILIILFGKTGEKQNKPGKQIMLGVLTKGANNTVAMEPFIERAPEGEGKLGHPLGLAVDPVTKDIYFGDIIDGRIYKIEIGGEQHE